MKKLLLICSGLLSVSSLVAQPWIKQRTVKPQKLQDIIEAYNAPAGNAEEENEQEGKQVNEGKNYHFSRWVWYWERHLDENGYMVSPIQAMQEWRNWTQLQSRSQNKGTKTTNASNWRFIGPDKSAGGYSGIGRINVVAFHPLDTNTFWIGSGGGGAWKTTDNGISWSAINDYFPVLGVSDIDFNPQNPNTIYLCTGDRDASDTYSAGVLKSYDGGATWDTTGLKYNRTDFVLTNTLIINPLDSNSLLLAASNGIFKSYDGGTTWTSTNGGSFKEIIYSPIDTNVVYAAGFTTGSSQVFRSADGGLTWIQTSNFPGNSRISVAVTPANPAVVKVVVSNQANGLEGIYNSTDTGKNFTEIFNSGVNCSTNILASAPKGDKCGGQGWYDLTININPVNEHQVVVGGVNTWFSTDGGATWKIANQWTSSLPGVKVVHADKHYHIYHPLRPGTLFECNDGGIYFTLNPQGSIWNDITNGLGITQFYRNAVSGNAPYVIGGAQDNGTKKLENGTYSDLTGGDGMDCQIDYTDAKVFYTSQQYGEIRRTKNGGTNFTDISNKIPGGQPTGDWITPIIIDPKISSVLYVGFDRIYMSEDMGETWKSISPNFGGKIKRISRGNDNVTICFLVNNRIYLSKDLGENWTALFPPFSGTLSDVKVDPKNPEMLWMTFNGYGNTQVISYSAAGGWKDYNTGLPKLPVNCIEIDPVDGTAYIGTDIGVFYKFHNSETWETYSASLPTTEVIDLGINNVTGEIYAATYGRGMWVSPTISFPVSTPAIPYAANVITLAPNPNSGRFAIQTANKSLIGEDISVHIISVTGATVWQNNLTVDAEGKAAIDTRLPKGNYIVNINKGGMLFSKTKMIVY